MLLTRNAAAAATSGQKREKKCQQSAAVSQKVVWLGKTNRKTEFLWATGGKRTLSVKSPNEKCTHNALRMLNVGASFKKNSWFIIPIITWLFLFRIRGYNDSPDNENDILPPPPRPSPQPPRRPQAADFFVSFSLFAYEHANSKECQLRAPESPWYRWSAFRRDLSWPAFSRACSGLRLPLWGHPCSQLMYGHVWTLINTFEWTNVHAHAKRSAKISEKRNKTAKC